MPLSALRIHSTIDWLFELKLDGFRAIAHIEGHHCKLVSRRGHTFKHWPMLTNELAHAVRCDSAILDGEICCLDEHGRSDFKKLLFRRDWPFFFALDLLELNGCDLHQLPLIERKIRLKRIMPKMDSRVRYVDHIVGSGKKFFERACAEDLEGIVGKWRFGNALLETRVGGAERIWRADQHPESRLVSECFPQCAVRSPPICIGALRGQTACGCTHATVLGLGLSSSG
jgi:ATP-dependent DNA ligase